MIFVAVRSNVCGRGNAQVLESFTYLLGGGDDILRPPSEVLLSPIDIFLASIDCNFPAATLSLLIVSSAGAVLNWIRDCRRRGSVGRRKSLEELDTAIDARWPSFPIGPNESLKMIGAVSWVIGCEGEVESCSGTVSREW